MTIRTVEISPGGPLAQGELEHEEVARKLRKCKSKSGVWFEDYTVRTGVATVRTGPSTTATGRLTNPADDEILIGTSEGETCNRVPEPDEDAPRGYRAKPCRGVMISRQEGAEYFETHWIECDTCGEIVE